MTLFSLWAFLLKTTFWWAKHKLIRNIWVKLTSKYIWVWKTREVLGGKAHLGFYKPNMFKRKKEKKKRSKQILKCDLSLSLSWSAKLVLSSHRKRKSRNRRAQQGCWPLCIHSKARHCGFGLSPCWLGRGWGSAKTSLDFWENGASHHTAASSSFKAKLPRFPPPPAQLSPHASYLTSDNSR